MRDFFDLLDTLADKAIEHQPKVKDFGRPERETLEDRPFLTTEDAPQWHSNSDLKEDQRNAAAAVHVWLVERVFPVLDAIAKDADATAVIIGALPRPRLPKKPKKDGRGRLHSDSAWGREFQSDTVFLWAAWATWNDLVGTKWPVPPAPKYPHQEGLSVDDRERFKALIVTRPVVTLALNGQEFTGRAVAALCWLRTALAKRARQVVEAPTGNGGAPVPPSKEARALALLVEHPDWTDKQIAKKVPCNAKSLYRWQRFMAAREAAKQGHNDLPHGTKYPDGDGESNLEAWDDENM